MLASISSSFTHQVASHGVYAVFLLMMIDAIFPAASEIVMLYAGAVASGLLSSAHQVSVFGLGIHYGIGAYLVMALAGTLGYFVGALLGWAIGRWGVVRCSSATAGGSTSHRRSSTAPSAGSTSGATSASSSAG